MSFVDTITLSLRLGTHPELSTLMKEIEDKRDQRLRVARAWRTHMNEISQAEFEIKEYQAHCTFQVRMLSAFSLAGDRDELFLIS